MRTKLESLSRSGDAVNLGSQLENSGACSSKYAANGNFHAPMCLLRRQHDLQGIWEKEMVGGKLSFAATSAFWNLGYASVPLAMEKVPELFRVFLLVHEIDHGHHNFFGGNPVGCC